MTRLICLVLVLPSLGCAGAILRPDDSTPAKAAKVMVRAPLAVATLGGSEVIVGVLKARERRGSGVRSVRPVDPVEELTRALALARQNALAAQAELEFQRWRGAWGPTA